MTVLKVFRVGAAAVEALAQNGRGKVIGVTSKGVFLRIDDRIAFLTSADYSSPFNLTVVDLDSQLETLQVGEEFDIHEDGLRFSREGLLALTIGAELVQSSAPVMLRAAIEAQLERAQGLAGRLRLLAGEKGFLFLSRPSDQGLQADQAQVYLAASEMVNSYENLNSRGFLRQAGELLGKGGGLTPSGDDFVTGFLLYHVRYNQATDRQDAFLDGIFNLLVPLAFKKTTTISANRLLYAGRGWSEGLFLQLIDTLFDPQVEFTMQDLNMLVRFGHSSGIDTFMGMLYAVRSRL